MKDSNYRGLRHLMTNSSTQTRSNETLCGVWRVMDDLFAFT